jgi:thioredoxin-like negative regulator of GroEL
MSGFAMSLVLQTAILTGGAQPYEEAFKSTQENNRPLLVLVGADWCPGCRVMKQSVMPRMVQAGKLQSVNFTEVNSDLNPAVAARLMRGGAIPQLIVFAKTPNGWHREQITGATSEAGVQAMIERAIRVQKSATVPVSHITSGAE